MRANGLNRLSSIYVNKSSPYFLHYSSFHDALFNAIKKYSKGDVLDIGCGNKPYEKIFDGLIDNYVGCDVVQSNLNKVDVISPANKIPIADASFNTVISTQVIEHVEDYQGLLLEAFRLLKPESYLILSGPLNWQLHEEPYDFFRFTKHGFRHIIEKSGFELIDIKENGGMWAVSGQYLIKNIANNSPLRNKRLRFCLKVLKKLKIVYVLNSLFSFLDRIDYNPINTINYVVVAKKN